MQSEQKDFYDELSEKLYHEAEWKLRDYPGACSSKVMLELGTFNIAESYVTSKVENREGDTIKVNIEGGRSGIELQETLFNLKGKNLGHAYVMTNVKQDLDDTPAAAASNRGQSRSIAWRQQHNTITKVLVRRLPVIGLKDWLIIYEDTLFLLAVKDAYDEMEIIAFTG
jgi:hypothetical protein